MVTVRRSSELEQLQEESLQRFNAGDNDWFAANIADGEVIAWGTAPEEIWRGRDSVLSMTVQAIRELNASAGLVEEADPERQIEAYEAGDTGWAVVHSHFRLSDGSTVPTRTLWIYARDEDGWKLVAGGPHVVASNDLIAPGSPLAATTA